MVKRLIGISVALSVLVAAWAADAASSAQRVSAHGAMRQQAPIVRVAVQRPSFRPTAYRPMSQQAERPDLARSLRPGSTRAESAEMRASSQRAELLQVRHELQCVPSRTCGRLAAAPTTERHQDRKALKQQLAKDKPSAEKF